MSLKITTNRIMRYGHYSMVVRQLLLLSALLFPCGRILAREGGMINSDSARIAFYAQIRDNIRSDHPRVFINRESLDDIRARARGVHRGYFERTGKRIDGMLGQAIIFKDSTIVDGRLSNDHKWGYIASDAALLYLVTGDTKYLAYTKRLLVRLGQYYTFRTDNKRNIYWFAYSRICALAAFDWIYNDLSEEDRRKIGASLLTAFDKMIPDGRRGYYMENTSGYRSGYYGSPSLAWYAGLAFLGTGVDEQVAEKLLARGIEDHRKMLEYRKNVIGDDGGGASSAINYTFANYPWSEFNFFHSVFSSTGISLAQEYPTQLGMLYYLIWNWLPGRRSFGYGDQYHHTNELPLWQMHIHLAQLMHFYGESHPEIVRPIEWVLQYVKETDGNQIPFARYLLDRYPVKEPVTVPDSELTGKLPAAMHFENMGQIFMRSGSGVNDTYAMFSAGGILSQHRHYDNNNFVIYRNGFRALDTGTRPSPGQHLSRYYCRTVAHNCITVTMPGEEMPPYWGRIAPEETALPVPNDGGQRNILASEVIAYSQSGDYVYIASDATRSYHSDKISEVVRQFVFIQPDIFLVFDRVTSKDPGYQKRWLLHFVSEPEFLKGGEFTEQSGGGRLFCRTVFPADAKAEAIGGPGRQFWSGGRNWPLPRIEGKPLQDTIALLGQWRVEVSPGSPENKDHFLHLIQVGDNSLKRMVSSERIEKEHEKGVRFAYRQRSYEVTFSTTDRVGGRIMVKEGKAILLNEKFTSQVEPQQAWGRQTDRQADRQKG